MKYLFTFQLALHLSDRGFRVFAGLREIGGTETEAGAAAQIVRQWQKHREAEALVSPGSPPRHGKLIPLHIDVTREDIMHDALDAIRKHLPAGEDGNIIMQILLLSDKL